MTLTHNGRPRPTHKGKYDWVKVGAWVGILALSIAFWVALGAAIYQAVAK